MKYVFVLALLLRAGIGFCQTPEIDTKKIVLTLDQAFQLAFKNNKNIRISQLVVAQAAETLRNSQSNLYPTINVSGWTVYQTDTHFLTQYNNHPTAQPQVMPVNSQLGIFSELHLYKGKLLQNTVKEQRIAYKNSIKMRDVKIADTKLEIVINYSHILRLEKSRGFILGTIKESRERLKKMQDLFEQGMSLRSDLVRAKVQITRQELKMAEIVNSIALANNNLCLMLGLPAGTLPLLSDSISCPKQALVLADLLAEAHMNAHEISIGEQQQALSKIRLSLVQAQKKPVLSAYFIHQFNYLDLFISPPERYLYGLWQLGLKFSYGISSLYQVRHQINVAKLETNRKELELDNTKDTIGQKTLRDWLRFNESLRGQEISADNIQLATENYRIVKNRYFAQLALLTDLLDADSLLLQSQFDHQNARISSIINYYNLLRTIGRL